MKQSIKIKITTMFKTRVLKHAMFAAFILKSITMLAQTDTMNNQFLNKQQQNIVTIAALNCGWRFKPVNNAVKCWS